MALAMPNVGISTSHESLSKVGGLKRASLQPSSKARLRAAKTCALASSSSSQAPLNSSPSSDPKKDASYLARAECGAVECTSRGCRPVLGFTQYPDNSWHLQERDELEPFTGGFCASSSADTRQSAAAPQEVDHGCRIEMWSLNEEGESVFTVLPCAEELLPLSNAQTRTRDRRRQDSLEFQPAVSQSERLLELAEYTWRQMGDLARAEMLFEKALEEDPGNSTALASYALFLWEFEAQQPEKCLL